MDEEGGEFVVVLGLEHEMKGYVNRRIAESMVAKAYVAPYKPFFEAQFRQRIVTGEDWYNRIVQASKQDKEQQKEVVVQAVEIMHRLARLFGLPLHENLLLLQTEDADEFFFVEQALLILRHVVTAYLQNIEAPEESGGTARRDATWEALSMDKAFVRFQQSVSTSSIDVFKQVARRKINPTQIAPPPAPVAQAPPASTAASAVPVPPTAAELFLAQMREIRRRNALQDQ